MQRVGPLSLDVRQPEPVVDVRVADGARGERLHALLDAWDVHRHVHPLEREKREDGETTEELVDWILFKVYKKKQHIKKQKELKQKTKKKKKKKKKTKK